jgi:hypothetical protein
MSCTWNHRVIFHEDGYLAIHEVYYANGKPKFWTERATGVSGETVAEIVQNLRQMEEALNKPFLTIKGKKLVNYRGKG